MHSFRKLSMKKFIFKCCLALIPIFAWFLYAHFASYYYMDSEYPYWMQQKDYINNNHDYNDLVIIGDSTAKVCYRPNLVSEFSSVNLALGGANSVEMYYTLKTYLQNHEKPQVVVFAMAASDYMFQMHHIDRNVYFHYLSPFELKEVRTNSKIYDDYRYWNAEGTDKTIAKYYMYDPEVYLPAVINAGFVGRYDYNKAQYNWLESERGWMLFGTAPENHDKNFVVDLGAFPVNGINGYYVEKIIELCEANEIQLVIEQTPINESSYGEVHQVFIDPFTAYFDGLAAEHPSIIAKNMYMGYPDTCFGDHGHLNETGAAVYTRYLVDTYGYLIK